jgi:hypothetical protein
MRAASGEDGIFGRNSTGGPEVCCFDRLGWLPCGGLPLLPFSIWSRPAAVRVAALCGYVALTLAFSWPLPLHLGTQLTGPPGGDTGVYVWNQWVFRHELVEHHSLPLFTREIFSLSRPANLSLHNYTIFQDLIALPLLPLLGVVTTFNVVYLLMIVLTGYAAFALAWHITERPLESWLAGALFAWSPWLVTRGIGHFSLVAAAPLPVFVLLLLRCEERARIRDALALGATVCWAATTDPYYAVYCVMIASLVLGWHIVRVTRRAVRGSTLVPRALELLMACVGGFAASLLVGRGWQLSVLGMRVSAHELYTPMLLLTLLTLLRLAWPFRHAALSVDRVELVRLVRAVSVAALVSAVMLSPVLYAVGIRIRDAGFESSRILWRSSPPGVDLVSFFLPNPNHPLAPHAIRDWLTPRADLYLENVASLPWVALVAIAVALRTGWKPSRLWIALTVTFGLLALGPFIHVAGINTHIPGPWALARYLPLVRLARTPARLAIVAMLGMSILFAAALRHLGDRWPHRRRLVLSTVAALMLFELLPAPRPLYSASVPGFYSRVAAAPGDVRLLELPVGVRDGTSSIGNFTARSQFFQTVHGKPLMGGYLSRVSRRRIADVRQEPILDALITLSEGGTLAADHDRDVTRQAMEFVRRARIGFVVIDNSLTTPQLREFAVRALRLQRVDGDEQYDLYVPQQLSDDAGYLVK